MQPTVGDDPEHSPPGGWPKNDDQPKHVDDSSALSSPRSIADTDLDSVPAPVPAPAPAPVPAALKQARGTAVATRTSARTAGKGPKTIPAPAPRARTAPTDRHIGAPRRKPKRGGKQDMRDSPPVDEESDDDEDEADDQDEADADVGQRISAQQMTTKITNLIKTTFDIAESYQRFVMQHHRTNRAAPKKIRDALEAGYRKSGAGGKRGAGSQDEDEGEEEVEQRPKKRSRKGKGKEKEGKRGGH